MKIAYYFFRVLFWASIIWGCFHLSKVIKYMPQGDWSGQAGWFVGAFFGCFIWSLIPWIIAYFIKKDLKKKGGDNRNNSQEEMKSE